MKVVLNVKGTKLSVLAIRRSETGKLQSVYAKDENGPETHYVDKSESRYYTNPHVALENLEGLLEYPEVEARIVDDRNKLIEHLEDMYKEEVQTLEDLKTEMAETRTELPCEKIGDLLAQKQNEYFLMQQRVFGIIDTIEEAKACTEGFYANVEDPAVEA